MVNEEILIDLKIMTAEIMKNEGVSLYDLHIQGQTEKGTNYCSEIIFFSVTPKKSKKEYNLVMKTTKRSGTFREAAADGVTEIREMFMYSQVFPALRKMLEESKCPFCLENIPKTYLVNTKYRHETVIMDNLRSLGYRLWDRKKPMNLEHIKTVMTTYGNFHASSIALRQKTPEVFQAITREMDNVWESFVDNEIVENLFTQYVSDAFLVLNQAGLDHLTMKLKGIPENAVKILANNIDEEDKVVITHGDCWINNMMFEYKNPDNLQPTGVCFLDFQLSSLRSPVTDLSYFLYTACDSPTLENEFENLLNLYYQQLSLTLKSLDVDSQKVFSFDKLKEHWKKYSIEGILMASQVIKIQLANKDEAMDFSDLGKEGVDHTKFMLKDIAEEEDFKKRIIGVYTHYAKTCLEE